MKILFICGGNVGRSQIAKAFFDKLSIHESVCAGINVGEKEGERLKDMPLAKPVIECMKDVEDLSENTRKQSLCFQRKEFDFYFILSVLKGFLWL